MNRLILHHFDASPFAEKARLAMGIKGLEWHSVEIPMIMPKPDLMPLTGGYRKTPVLQIGAEVYCDTRLILEVLEQREPRPPLLPAGTPALAFAAWSDTSFFEPGAALSMALNKDIPEPVLADRKAFFEFMDFDELADCGPHMLGQFLAQVEIVEAQLSDGREFFSGDAVSALDVLAYFPLWMARGNVPGIEGWLAGYRHTARWEARMRDFGHGDRREMSAEEALRIAAAATPLGGDGVGDDPSGFGVGERVSVTPTDYGGVAVVGELITLNLRRISLRRQHPRLGEVNTHFPRSGYRVEAH